MPTITFKNEGVCSRETIIEYDDNLIITNAKVNGGCQGNLQGICALLVGMKVNDVVNRLSGIKCRGSRSGESSCPDQIAKGLIQLLK